VNESYLNTNYKNYNKDKDNKFIVKKIDLNDEAFMYDFSINTSINENENGNGYRSENEENFDFECFINKYRHQTKVVDKVYKEKIEINKKKFYKVVDEVANKSMIKMVEKHFL
jgi:hypothetical protein